VEGDLIPIGPIIVAARLASGAASRGQARQTNPRHTNVALRVFFGIMAAGFCAGMSESLGRLGYVAWLFFGAAMLPAVTLRYVLVPLGLARTSYWFAVLTVPLAHSREIRGGAALMAALALVRRRRVSARTIDWLDRQLSLMSQSSSLAITAAGVLAAARGKKETARRVFHAVDVITERAPRIARRVAREWLVADAAERGAWDEVVLVGRPGWRQIAWPRTMGAIARRLTSMSKAAPNAVLLFAWLASPHRLATLPILRRAMAVPRRTNDEPELAMAPPPQQADALAPALLAHAAAIRSANDGAIVAAGVAWDGVRTSGQAGALFARRAVALETKATAESGLARLLETAEHDLAPLVAKLPAERTSGSPTLGASSRLARRKAMIEIESLTSAMAQRTARKESLHTSGEWMEWGALRRSCELATHDATLEVRRTVFATVYNPACNHAVWLFNTQGEKLLANGMFRWLAREARAVNDAAAITLLDKNVKAGEGVQ
jgi:hypothetical protein